MGNVMRPSRLFIVGSVLGVAAGLVIVACCVGHHAEIGAKLLRVEASTGDASVARVTVQFTNPGSVLVWFGPHQKLQAKARSEWLEPERLDGLSSFVMQPRAHHEIVIAVPQMAQACRLLLSYGDTPQRTKWAWFCSRHDKISSKVPNLCFWVGQRLRKDPEWRSRVLELVLPNQAERSATSAHGDKQMSEEY